MHGLTGLIRSASGRIRGLAEQLGLWRIGDGTFPMVHSGHQMMSRMGKIMRWRSENVLITHFVIEENRTYEKNKISIEIPHILSELHAVGFTSLGETILPMFSANPPFQARSNDNYTTCYGRRPNSLLFCPQDAREGRTGNPPTTVWGYPPTLASLGCMLWRTYGSKEHALADLWGRIEHTPPEP